MANTTLGTGPPLSAPVRPIRERAAGLRGIVRVAAMALLMLVPDHSAGARRAETLDPPGGQPPAPQQGGVLRFANEEVSTLDPKHIGDVYSNAVCFQIFRGLLIYSTNLTPVPDLARTWTISRDGRQYTFELNPGVHFHHGREVTAEDFVYTLERIFRPGESYGLGGQYLSAIEGADAYHEGRAPHIAGLSAPSRYTLEIRLSRPHAAFLWTLAMIQAAVVPREVVEKLGDAEFARRPVGCGPFKLVSNEPGLVRLAAWEHYYRPRAWLDSLLFVTPPGYSSSQGADLLLQGRCDLAPVLGIRRTEVAGVPDVRLISRRELNVTFIGMNTRIPPFNNVEVRRAFAFSVDRSLAARLDPSGQVMATGILPAGITCYSPEIRVAPYDLDQARQALARAGYPGGRGFPRIKFNAPQGSAGRHAVDSAMVATWRQLGIPVEVEHLGWIQHNRHLERKDLALFTVSWMADIPDPDSFVGSLFDSQSPNNMSRYANSGVDSLLELGRATVDLKTRQSIYGNIEKTILRDAPIIPLFTRTTSYGIRNRYRGLELTPLGISCTDLAHVWHARDKHVTEAIP